MSLKIEVADWRFEITWDGMLCTPLERNEAKAKPELNGSRRSRTSINQNTTQDSPLRLAQAASAMAGNSLINKRRETK